MPMQSYADPHLRTVYAVEGPPGPGTGAGAWKPSTSYAANQVVQGPDGSMIRRVSTGVSRASFDATEQAAWIALEATTDTMVAAALKGLIASLAARLNGVAATTATNGALAPMKHNPVDASGGARAMTLADATDAGQLVTVEKTDSSANTVTVTGNIRGSAGSSRTLVGQFETLVLASKSDGSWWPIAGHKTKTWLDATFAPGGSAGVPAIVGGPVASGDTSGATDATAINNAMNALATLGGGELVLGRGTYWINAMIQIPSNVTLRGLKRGVTVIKQAAGANIYSPVRNKNYTTSDANIGLAHLTIDGNGANQTGYSQCAAFQNVTGLTVDIEVINAAKEGIYFQGCTKIDVNIYASGCGRDGVVFDVSSGGASCSDIVGAVRTSYCGWTARSTVAAASDAATLPLTSITLASTAGFPVSGDVVIVSTPASGIKVSNYLTYTGITGNTLTGVTSSGTGTVHTGDFAGVPARSGCTLRAASDFDLTVHSYSPGYHGVDLSNTATKGKVRINSHLAGRYGAYCGLGPTDVQIDGYTTGSGYGGYGGESNGEAYADIQFSGISDGDQYGVVLDSTIGDHWRGTVKNSIKHGVWLAGARYSNIDLVFAYDNGQGQHNTYRDVFISANSLIGTGHPAANSTHNDVHVGVSYSDAANKPSHCVSINSTGDNYNRISIGSIDGPVAPTVVSGSGSSSTRNWFAPSGGLNPMGYYILPASGSFQLDPRNGRTQAATLTGAATITTLNGYMAGDEMLLILTQDATGGRTVTFSGSNWRLGSYTPTTTAGKRDIIGLQWDGTVWNLKSLQQAL